MCECIMLDYIYLFQDWNCFFFFNGGGRFWRERERETMDGNVHKKKKTTNKQTKQKR